MPLLILGAATLQHAPKRDSRLFGCLFFYEPFQPFQIYTVESTDEIKLLKRMDIKMNECSRVMERKRVKKRSRNTMSQK